MNTSSLINRAISFNSQTPAFNRPANIRSFKQYIGSLPLVPRLCLGTHCIRGSASTLVGFLAVSCKPPGSSALFPMQNRTACALPLQSRWHWAAAGACKAVARYCTATANRIANRRAIPVSGVFIVFRRWQRRPRGREVGSKSKTQSITASGLKIALVVKFRVSFRGAVGEAGVFLLPCQIDFANGAVTLLGDNDLGLTGVL